MKFGSQYKGTVGRQSSFIEKCSDIDLDIANNYVESKIPGIKKLYDSNPILNSDN